MAKTRTKYFIRFLLSFIIALIGPLLLIVFALGCSDSTQVDLEDEKYRKWSTYLGGKGSTHYSSLDQINVENVHKLEVAWTFSVGDTIEGGRTVMPTNPIIVDNVMYGTTPLLKLFAVRADTGELLWLFDPFKDQAPAARGANRGVAYWTDGKNLRRLFYVAQSRLYGINADTGVPAAGFGEGGSVDFKSGFGRDVSDLFVSATSPGIIYKNLLIQGSRVSELANAAPGDIRAYNVLTGEIEWIFHTIPHPGEFGYETWPPDAWREIGGANCWTGMSLDEERGMVYIPTGSPAFDFYGGDRIGANLFANCLLALNAATGERIWHYQFVRHDLWDRDLPAPPNLVTVRHEGRLVDAVAQVTKSGHIFVFDREDGSPLFPIVEIDAPPSDLKGEEAWPSQPEPLIPAPFARQEFGEDDLTDISEESRKAVLEQFRKFRTGHRWDPPSLEGTLIYPGFNGGAEWGGAGFDPETGILYVNSNELLWSVTMVEIDVAGGGEMKIGQRVFAQNCAGCHGTDRAGDAQGQVPGLIDVGEKLNDDELQAVIKKGKGVMPAFGHLAPHEIKNLVNYLKSEIKPGAKAKGAKVQKASKIPYDHSSWKIPYAHMGWKKFFDPEGYPAIKPPWGTLNAIDLNTGEYVWKIPLGEFEELTKKGIPPTGTENYGGPAITAGGLLFIGATQDNKFRAFNKATGDLLWERDLPAGGYATPSVYEVDGKQYVVIAAGGGKMGSKSTDLYVAFSLPEE